MCGESLGPEKFSSVQDFERNLRPEMSKEDNNKAVWELQISMFNNYATSPVFEVSDTLNFFTKKDTVPSVAVTVDNQNDGIKMSLNLEMIVVKRFHENQFVIILLGFSSKLGLEI